MLCFHLCLLGTVRVRVRSGEAAVYSRERIGAFCVCVCVAAEANAQGEERESSLSNKIRTVAA